MKLEDFNNIDLQNVGSLPFSIKAVLLGVLGLVLVGLGYWFMWSPALDELDQSVEKEKELRTVFLTKKSQAIKIDAYRQQMVEIEKTFGALLKQLPDKSEMDGLLTDVNQAGLGRGLEFELFKPGQETVAEFYAEMPIQIKVLGGYHDLGAFATDVSKLPRIVTLNNLIIQPASKETKDGRLVLEAVAKTYRYLDSSEISARKSADKKVSVK
ncbi:Tfp pilus assembly protein PilO [Methylophilaceae bacterium 11]|jgi:type IV pilus assembly protein PilO|uniref:type 4a pilus biogenesis protein PilO n=1 Tax=unclassified Methylotenera TaxID=2643294 RepID=UPI0003703B13|nr:MULTISPECIES: type 4a pilus biogenesis protein PilO [unclassified Methylotenera]EUJ11556.1 Tfp pilus assembly protein PilO [Methylophilaceae bacterium 11]